MTKTIKRLFIIVICLPVILFCGCNKFKPQCKELSSITYYFNDKITCSVFNSDDKKEIKLSSLCSSSIEKNMLDAYAKMTITANSAEVYHLYIEYICFNVYTTETKPSEYELGININISNVVDQSEIYSSYHESTTFSDTKYCPVIKDNSSLIKIYVNKTVEQATGLTMTIDILDSDTYTIDKETTLKWGIYNFKIYGEPRAY